ncbi:MAG: hypothetical protein GTN62_06180 [Gemmatimonadales bacterium]|nr:hypothetical protein [Gemmatimonadales bacterium]NIN11086.1 hypothetical protein [Gemmatimonadales bacterium]NIN49683.1 hypothetical protein [Gemmatimonadales bacterium]NIP07147.1 hypothetical protein [Gemmatimonadales bacterium]NIQ99538.1 hypothetical protein [Gemmatimonadales bacterium]
MWLAYATALALGAAHALEVDHMVAVSTFVGNRPRFAAAVSFGARWGVGHSLAVLIVGTALAWSGIGVPEGVAGWTDLGVGLMLVALGIGALRAVSTSTIPRGTEGTPTSMRTRSSSTRTTTPTPIRRSATDTCPPWWAPSMASPALLRWSPSFP